MKALQFLLLLIILFSCKEIESDYDKREKQRKIIYEKKKDLLSKVSLDYNLLFAFDTLTFDYSYMYQEIIESNPYQILNDFVIHDIYKTDSCYRVLISNGCCPTFYYDMVLSDDQKKYIEQQYDTDLFYNWSTNLPYFFIIEIKSLNRLRFSVYPTGEDYDLSYEIEVSDNYVCEAEIIKIETVK